MPSRCRSFHPRMELGALGGVKKYVLQRSAYKYHLGFGLNRVVYPPGYGLSFFFICLAFISQESGGEPPTKSTTIYGGNGGGKFVPKEGLINQLVGRLGDGVNGATLVPCNRSRHIIKDSSWGIISDGLTNYTQDTTCEWLISAPPGHWISLKVDRVLTECSYDYLFIVDGLSYINDETRHGRLLASFSGASDPHVTILAQSGHMLILLYSDPNYVLEGFQAEYSISACPLNCSSAGECIQIQNEHICRCEESRTGVACQLSKTKPLPVLKTKNNVNNLNSNTTQISSEVSESDEQEIELEKFEVDNNKVLNSDPHHRTLLAASWQSSLARVGHSVHRLQNQLFIYGGFDLNSILDDLITFDLRNNRIKTLGNWTMFQASGWPIGRFGHASVQVQNGFFVHGGKTIKREITGELFYYNATSRTWRDFPVEISSTTVELPRLIYHTMTLTPSGHIYVYGGGAFSGEFSSKLYRFHENYPEKWVLLKSSCCGKSTHRSVLGHSMTYWADKEALILFGGVGSSDFGRFSRLSSQLWIYMLNSSTWLQLDYKKNGGIVPGHHPERAFHTAHLADHYLTIVGGYTHVHNRDETCYSDQMLVYNLECQILIPASNSNPGSPSGSSSGDHIPTQGLFGHQSIIFKEELLIIGGYRGYLSQNVKKIHFPFTKTQPSNCLSFDRWRCSGEPKCGWCPTNSKCFDKLSGGSNCTTNLQTVQCPGICPLLSSCQSCVSVIPGCVWCGSLEQCVKDAGEESRLCGSTTSNSNSPHAQDHSQQSNQTQCSKKSFRTGATQFEYRFPMNLAHPDNVKIINSSTLIIHREYSSSVPSDSPVTFALRGSLVGYSLNNPTKKLELCALQAAVNLTLSSPEEIMNISLRWTDYQLCYNLTWPSGKPVLLLPNLRIRFDLSATSFGKGVSQEKSGRVAIQQKYSGPSSSPRALKKENLLPFETAFEDNPIHREQPLQNPCLSYSSCLSCAGDALCLWQQTDTSSTCIPRSHQTRIKLTSTVMNFSNKSIVIQPEDCPMCSDMNFCEDCVQDQNGVGGDGCEWWEEEMSCQRRGRIEGAVRTEAKCPSTCSTRSNCSSCLESPGKCVWCEQRQECFVFSVYTSLFQYGQCFQWMDKGEQCKRCDRQPTCESCVLNMGCGWNYDENGGACSEGDFGGPYSRQLQLTKNGDSSLITQELRLEGTNKTWTYGECPDVDECELGIHDCHPNATCVNTPGSFTCLCAQGFTGDGRTSCDQTCHEPCIHGTCSPQFVCECDLGWTGVACSIDCGCNNHSYCETGKCDLCKDYTQGPHCELCAEGSYGNATLVHVGCTPCNCNGHGDLSIGLCDPSTGHCFCLNNTTGKDCSECSHGFYGDPGEGRPCYQSCSGRGFMEAEQGHFGLPPEIVTQLTLRKRQMVSMYFKNASNVHIEHCLWIIRAPQSLSNEGEAVPLLNPGIQITIEAGLNIPCSHNVLLVYSGYSDFGLDRRKIPLVAAVCNDEVELSSNTQNTHVTVTSQVVTILLKYARMGSAKFSFNASFKFVEMKEVSGRSATNPFSPGSSFNISKLYDGPSLSVLSRYGHSLHVEQKNLWIFGGYSLSHGPLNDIRHYSRESNSWVPLTITVVQNEEAVPPSRYFHGGAIGPNSVIFIHGGISTNLTFLADSWKFDTRTSRWSKFCEGPNESPRLAGQTLTHRPGTGAHSDTHYIVMIGGFNPVEGFSDKVYSIGVTECWSEVETTGSNPLGVYGHSTVYHENTDTFYVFGGTLHDIMGLHQVSISSRLFVLNWGTKRWSVLSPMDENQVAPLPPPRFLHSGVSTDSYMVLLGGIGSSSKNSSALIYVYQCNLWILLSQDQEKKVLPAAVMDYFSDSNEDRILRIAGASAIWKNEIVQMGGWTEGTTSESLFLLSVPEDACSFQKSKQRCKGTLGCSYCSSNNNRTHRCYNSEMDMPTSCSSGASNIEFWQGSVCSAKWISQQSCGRFLTCTECVAGWPSHPNVTQGCQWCTNGKVGRCIALGKKQDEDNPCGQASYKQWEITDSSHCPERLCSAPQCEKCTASGKCIWTRQILRSRERSWELRLQPVYDWNCVRKSILDTSPSVTIVSSPPASCPIPCFDFSSCQECLESPGAEGGFHQCYWSVAQRRCISPAYSSLLCFGGICGPILKGPPSICPKSCTTFRSCSSCLEDPSCGWCSVEGENGDGVCLATDLLPETGLCSNGSKWNYLKCPVEDECLNGHHGCDSKSEQCIDLEEGYRCQCRVGYERSDTVCVPICSDGCVHGSCKEPGMCSCNFGYVGQNCSFQCDCNGHSDCYSVDRLDQCLTCRNNTMGPKCSQCKPMFVGDPRNNGVCVACREYCNGHSSVCLSHDDYNKWCNGTNKYLSSSQLISQILSSGLSAGPSTTAFCCHCKNQTNGDTCNDCTPGYFRGYDDKRLPCRKCECHGHGDVCDPVTGHECNCHNNTESEHCSQNTLKQNPHYQCWKHQCSKCRESYLGNPTNGHQCYRQMHVDLDYCFDPKSQESCVMKQKPLLSGRTVFFAVQPKFMNVNIRVTLDVTHGSINVYLSPKDDTFVVKQDDHNWIHRVDFDAKYGLTGERKEGSFSKTMREFSGESSNKIEPDYELPLNKSEEAYESGTSRVIPKPSSNSNGFRYIEHEAAGYATYYAVQDPKAILLVRNLRNRLVITLPQDSHDLRVTRFYLVLEGIGDVSFGSVFFRQDQLHIDLFVFFSVFFSAFFLFLAGCGVAWKVKQNMEARRARHRHVAEMLSMAKRPFAVWTILMEPDNGNGTALVEAYNQCRKSCRKGCICLRPVAVECTAGTNSSNGVCTMFITLPGGSSSPVGLCIGSVLSNMQRSHPPYHARRRRFQH